jgi:outer membrane protein TolC
LGVLLGAAPRFEIAQIPLGQLRAPRIGAGLPSELLRRRPDIAAAEARLVAANADVSNALASRFPSLSLTGAAGYQSSDLGRMFDPTSQIFSLAAGLTAPLFQGGRLEGAQRLQQARFEELAATYQKSVVQAFADVETALSGIRRTREQLDAQSAATDASRVGFEAAQAQYRVGSIDSVTLRDTQRSYSPRSTRWPKRAKATTRRWSLCSRRWAAVGHSLQMQRRRNNARKIWRAP